MKFQLLFLNCNLDTRREGYGLENTGISHGIGATKNSRNWEIPETQTFPSHFPGNRSFPGISHPWFPIEHPCDMEMDFDTVPWYRLIQVLHEHYYINLNIIGTIRHMYINTRG